MKLDVDNLKTNNLHSGNTIENGNGECVKGTTTRP